ncbi:DUF6139 family protein [Yersinia massiliensis]|uniref:Lipoprotein n=1 Tax=Yersinia massiliensis TaxID=419257 RepID=A0A2R4NQN5_9GAMM|nr:MULTISPECIES: DUF6139 family protein [Yersinia]AVX38424.1 hypothetical protein DA391_12580 [Yersinia massiliensis]MDA5547347.1 DUF6139 family protein [Yersinia massiliensis]NIL24946.1 hypothetical protein [Yersinia massiliensis]OWF70753.1 hypothetical protein B4902_21835 [Yersinia frederiksenii]PHZ22039.1 hypothetical protein CS535_19640 [Yersinia massiliensis]
MNVKMMATLASMIVLTGCASSLKPETVKAENGSSVDVFSVPALAELNDNRIADNKLREVTPTHNTVGKSLAVLSVLAGSFRSSDFDKENYKGTAIDSLPNPTDTYLTPKLKQNISQWMAKNASGYVYKQPLYIGHATWALIFKDAAANDTMYQLKYKVIIYKRPEDGSMFSAYAVAECAPTPVEATQADWSANRYAKVTTETEKYMNSCLLEFNSQLPRLLNK